MDERLVEAARVGDVIALQRMLEEDPQVLEKASLALLAESPLHVAALAGKVDFVKEIITLMPSLATHTTQQGLIPLHMASAQGYVEVVRELLKAKTRENQCVLKDHHGRTPLHYAVIRGEIGVVEEFMSFCPQCLEEVTAKRETVLRLAVKANHFDVLRMLMERLKTLDNFKDLFQAKDEEGKTVSELAAAKNQSQVLGIRKEDEKGNDRKKESCITIEEEGQHETELASKKEENEIITIEEEGHNDTELASKKEEEGSQSEGRSALFQSADAILVVATMIVALTYQGLSNPPPTLFKNGTEICWGCLFHRRCFRFGLNTLKKLEECPDALASSFLIFNTLIFLQSLCIVLWTLRDRRVAVARLLRWVTTFLAINYCFLLVAFSKYTAYFADIVINIVFTVYLVAIYQKIRGRKGTFNPSWIKRILPGLYLLLWDEIPLHFSHLKREIKE